MRVKLLSLAYKKQTFCMLKKTKINHQERLKYLGVPTEVTL